MNKKSLIEKFKDLNVDDPDSWASSQINEGKNNLSIAKTLKLLTNGVQKLDDTVEIRSITKTVPDPNSPFGVYGYILSKMLSNGLSEIEILYVLKCAQMELLNYITCTMDGVYGRDEKVSGIKICDIDNNSNNIKIIEGLHESLLNFEPDKNEMRPTNSLMEVLSKDPKYIKLFNKSK